MHDLEEDLPKHLRALSRRPEIRLAEARVWRRLVTEGCAGRPKARGRVRLPSLSMASTVAAALVSFLVVTGRLARPGVTRPAVDPSAAASSADAVLRMAAPAVTSDVPPMPPPPEAHDGGLLTLAVYDTLIRTDVDDSANDAVLGLLAEAHEDPAPGVDRAASPAGPAAAHGDAADSLYDDLDAMLGHGGADVAPYD